MERKYVDMCMECVRMISMNSTVIEKLNESVNDNAFYMKRDDLLPFSFGGNKARKALKFKEDIIEKKSDTIVTYGSSASNHCRVIANMAKLLGIKCYIVSPIENYKKTYNSQMIEMFEATIIKVALHDVSYTIDDLLEKLKLEGKNAYFIPGGGHGNLGTKAYVEAYQEIKKYENKKNIKFDYIFFASGTGTTQAGLVCGQYLNKDFSKKIVGISIARSEEKGRKIIIDSIKEYLNKDENNFENLVEFVDKYTSDGYGKSNQEILKAIKNVLFNNGIPLNSTYTGKAYYGMLDYIKRKNINNKNILFINTGGLPLFFDDMEELVK